MAKPTVRVLAPAALIVGETTAITIEVTADTATRVEHIDARFEGRQGWAVGSGKSRVEVDVPFSTRTVRLMEAGELPAATTTSFTTRFDVRPGTAPSHGLDPARARLRLHVHLALPWRFDAHHAFDLAVRLPPPAHVERTPVIVRSTPSAAAPDSPRLELSLASSRLIAGEILVGSLAIFHLDDGKPRDVELALVPMLRLFGRGRVRERRARAIPARVTLPAGSGGTSVPFRLQLPSTMVPSFETVTHALDWRLVASSGSLFGVKLELGCPLEVVDSAAAVTTAPLREAPRLADERVATLFADVATRAGWQPEPADPDADGPLAIARAVDVGEVGIGYAYRGEDGSFLEARLEHRSLGLGLTVAPGSRLRHLFWTDVEVDVAAWDRAHQVAARFPDQAIPFLKAVVPALMAAGRLGALVRWDDHSLVFERAVATVREEDVVEAMALVERLAATIATARAAIAPPPGLAIELPAWHELATWLDGDLAVGDLSLEGTLTGLPASVVLQWKEHRPVSLRATVGDPALASEEVRAISLRLAHPLADMLAASVPEAVIDCISRWPADFVDVEVADGVASASLRLPADRPSAVDAARVRELLLGLRALLAALTPPSPGGGAG